MKRPLTLMTIGFFALALTSCGGAKLPLGVSSDKVSGSLAAGTPKDTGTIPKDAGSQDITAIEQMILDQTNQARAVARTCGDQQFAATTPLTWNGYLAKSARDHSQDMADQDYFDHTAPNGSTLIDRNVAAGYSNWQELGENIAVDYDSALVVQGWINSPSHCKTLMNPKFKEIGAGYVDKKGSLYGYWTQEYGAR